VLVSSCNPSTSFVAVPGEVAYVAWLELDAQGAIRSSSPLLHAGSERVFAIDDETNVVFVGFPDEVGLRATDARLVAAAECSPQLPAPIWTHSVSGAEMELPRLSAPWVAEACSATPEVSAVVCEPCPIGCAGELNIASAAVPELGHLQGLVMTDDTTLIVTSPPSNIGFLGVPLTTSIGIIGPDLEKNSDIAPHTIPGDIVWDGAEIFVATEQASVSAFGAPPGFTREIDVPEGFKQLAAADGGPVLVFKSPGPVHEIVLGSTVSVPRPDLPGIVLDLDIRPGGSIAVLTPDAIVLFEDGSSESVALPLALRNLPAGAIISWIDRDVAVGVATQDVYLYQRTDDAWSPLGWVAEGAAEPRDIAAFAGGVLIVGRGPLDGGILHLVVDGITCTGRVHPAVNAVSARSGDRRAFAVTTGAGTRPLLVEINQP
jgi:hypothetical protein